MIMDDMAAVEDHILTCVVVAEFAWRHECAGVANAIHVEAFPNKGYLVAPL